MAAMPSGSDHDRVLEKVRALLAKAEATPYPAEAEAFTAKAQELLSRHRLDGIDPGSLGTAPAGGPGRRRFPVPRPYVTGKFRLLAGIARANHSEAVLDRAGDEAVVVGFGPDTDAVAELFTSLLLQGTSALLAAERAEGVDRSRTRSFRHAFWLAYGTRVAQRLAAATASAEAAAEADAPGVLPVLADRDAAVAAALTDSFGRLRTLRTSASNGAGLVAGRDAADDAELGVRARLHDGGR